MSSQEPTPRSAAAGTIDPDRLSERLQVRLRVLAARQLGDWSAAEDAAQEALARILEALDEDRLLDEQALPAFAYQTVRHVCQQWVRKQARRRRVRSRLAYESPAATQDAALRRLISTERRARMQRALGRLPTADRDLLRTLFGQAADQRSTAARLGISRNALRVRKHRALRRLAKLVRDELS